MSENIFLMKTLSVRERIIETASILFYENGYTQTGINQIIEEANVSKASMYHHFRSKEDIAVLYLQQKHILWMSKLVYCSIDKKNAKEKILEVFKYMDTWSMEVEYRGCSWQNIFTELPMDHHKIREQVILSKNQMRKWLRDTIKEDERCNNREANELGDQILVLMEGAYILSQIQKKAWPIENARKVCARLMS